MILSRTKPATPSSVQRKQEKKEKPTLEEFISNRNFAGARALLDWQINSGKDEGPSKLWLAYACFHQGDYGKAIDIYRNILATAKEPNPQIHTFIACCMFYLGMYKEAEEEAQKGTQSPMQTRLLFHIAHKFGDQDTLMKYHHRLENTVEDQLCLAAMHYLRTHYNEAIEAYKKLLLANRDFLALNVYIALCYYKLDYFDVALDVLGHYLKKYPDSPTALNLKACLQYRLFSTKEGEMKLKQLSDSGASSIGVIGDIIRHNLVVFRNGENALQVLPPLIDVIPEARLNLVIYYLRNDEFNEAYKLIADLEPTQPHEYILKAVVLTAYGQQHDTREGKECLRMAQQYFQYVGSSPNDCDTIPGRQCMGSTFFLVKQFEDAIVYLHSIQSYFQNDDDFNYNYGIAKAANGEFAEAEELLEAVQNEKYRNDSCYQSWLARCYIRNGKPKQAWELYIKLDGGTLSDSFGILRVIANDCFKCEHYYIAARAFDVLERIDPSPEYWEGKKASCIAAFKKIVEGKEPKETTRDLLALLRNGSNNPEVQLIIKIIKRWQKETKAAA